MTLDFENKHNKLLLTYEPNNTNPGYSYPNRLKKDLDEGEEVCIKRAFYFTKKDYKEHNEYYITFVLGEKINNYYKIRKELLGVDIDVYFYEEIDLVREFFLTNRQMSVFRRINNVMKEINGVKEDFRVGPGINEISIDMYKNLIKNFPKSTELDKYSNYRIEAIIGEFFNETINAKEKYEEHLNKKKYTYKGKKLNEEFKEYELLKYETILSKMNLMWENYDKYKEKDWQDEIMEIILLLFPKYVKVIKEVEFKEENGKKKRVDYLLVDANGDVDIIELKKPSEAGLLRSAKYRDHARPNSELVGSIIQIEKYIYYLNKGGQRLEDDLNNKYSDELPSNLRVRITNPTGIIIISSIKELSEEEKRDFKIIRSQYKNISNIFTHQDLILMLKNIIEKFKS